MKPRVREATRNNCTHCHYSRPRTNGPIRYIQVSLPLLDVMMYMQSSPCSGISTFGEKPDHVGPDHLEELFEKAREVIPSDVVEETPIFLLATAGMRLLPDSQRNKLLKEICSYTRSHTRFQLPDCDVHIQVIPGEVEGLYGWVAANYLLGGFDSPQEHNHGKGHHTYGFSSPMAANSSTHTPVPEGAVIVD